MAVRTIALLVVAGLTLGGCVHATLEPTTDANFTPRDKKLLANAPYAQATIPQAYQRHIVDYHRAEAPGSIVVDSDARYLYYVLPNRKAIRYGVTVGEDALSFWGVAKVGRKEEWPSWIPTADIKRRMPEVPDRVEGGAAQSARRARHLSVPGQPRHAVPHPRHQPARIYRAGDLLGLHPHDQ